MVNYIDLILLAIMALIVFISVKSGFFKTLFDLVAYFLAFSFAKSLSPVLAQSAFDSFIRKGAQSYLEASLSTIGTTDYVTQAEQVIESIPEGLRGLMQILGYSEETITQQIASSDFNGANLVESIMNTVVEPVGVALMQFILFVILAIVFLVVGKILVLLLNKIVKKLPIIKRVNSLLGGILGLIKGAVLIIVVSAALSVIASASDNQGFIDSINSSVLVNLFKDIIADFSF